MTDLENKGFSNDYSDLTTDKRNEFSKIVRKLLNVNFIVKALNPTEYQFIHQNVSLFTIFFKYMDFDFYLDTTREIAYYKTTDDNIGSRLNKNETIILLVLRKLYQVKLEEVSLDNEIYITTNELHAMLSSVGYAEMAKEKAKISVLMDALRKFRNHGLIDFKAKDIMVNEGYITIYSSIEVATDFKDLVEITSRLDALSKAGDDNE